MEFLLPILLIAVFYFLLIRPQQRQRKQMVQLQETLAPGTRVMTGSGLYGTIMSIEGDEVELEVAPGVTNRYARRAIVSVVQPETLPDDLTAEAFASDDTSSEDSAQTSTDDNADTSGGDVRAEDRSNGDDAR